MQVFQCPAAALCNYIILQSRSVYSPLLLFCCHMDMSLSQNTDLQEKTCPAGLDKPLTRAPIWSRRSKNTWYAGLWSIIQLICFGFFRGPVFWREPLWIKVCALFSVVTSKPFIRASELQKVLLVWGIAILHCMGPWGDHRMTKASDVVEECPQNDRPANLQVPNEP